MMATSAPTSINQEETAFLTIVQSTELKEEVALESKTSHKSDPDAWYVDSASTAQISRQRHWLENFDDICNGIEIIVANNEKLRSDDFFPTKNIKSITTAKLMSYVSNLTFRLTRHRIQHQ